MKYTIAIVDDEPDILNLVSLSVEKNGFIAKSFPDLFSFNNYLRKNSPNLIILDLMLPDGDGIEVCKELKKKPETGNIPIIMLTAKSEETDKIIGLELGADDYVTKPFSPKELVARIKAVLRRSEQNGQTKKNRRQLGKNIIIDKDKYEISVKGKKVETTTTEFKILYFLSSNPGIVFTRDQILTHLWGSEKAVIDRTIDVHIKHLREKLGPESKIIKNVRGVGYKCEI